jgi:hypothetical protein
MRQRRVRILHEGREYFLLDRGDGGSGHVITLLRRMADDESRGDHEVVLHCDAGDCVPVARWIDGAIEVEAGEKDADSLRRAFEELVRRYLEEFRVGKPAPKARPYWFLSSRQQPVFDLTRAQPSGLSVLVFSELEKARRAAAARNGLDAPAIEVEQTGSLADFLASRASEGFTGASLDEGDPIFFCLDPAGLPRFLRLSVTEDGHLEHSLLEEDGSWEAYDGEEELSLELDQDAADDNMRERLGDIPYLGFHEGKPLFRLGRRDDPSRPVPVRLDENTLGGGEFLALFHDRALGAAFLEEHELKDLELVEVDDLKALAAHAHERQLPLLLEPDSHRARGGALWMNHDHVVLDSFSGLWQSKDGRTFQKS